MQSTTACHECSCWTQLLGAACAVHRLQAGAQSAGRACVRLASLQASPALPRQPPVAWHSSRPAVRAGQPHHSKQVCGCAWLALAPCRVPSSWLTNPAMPCADPPPPAPASPPPASQPANPAMPCADPCLHRRSRRRSTSATSGTASKATWSRSPRRRLQRRPRRRRMPPSESRQRHSPRESLARHRL